jgi:DNA-binding CsgD family transcriptional regulator/phage portal protein BeeE
MGLIDTALARVGLQRYSLQQYIDDTMGYAGLRYPVMPVQTTLGEKQERPTGTFESYVGGLYKQNGIVFACMGARLMLFSQARFQFRRIISGRPGELFGNKSLALLEKPWTNATTGDLLARVIQDADLAGNHYSVRRGPEVHRLRPDWVGIIVGSRSAPDDPSAAIDAKIVGYAYYPGGYASSKTPEILLPEDVAHFAPIPDPAFRFRGMSWLTPALQEILGDQAATTHKLKYFEGGATPNMIVSLDKTFNNKETYEAFITKMREQHEGVENAYKTLYLGSGATATVVGSNFQQIDFKKTQGGGETRIAADAGVPPIIAGLSEGLEASTYSNYGQAKRAFGQGTMAWLWQNMAGSFEHLVDVPPGAELWYDERHIKYLQEDEKDRAEIMQVRAASARTFIDSGFDPDSVIEAVDADDITRLKGKHNGLYPVQQQPPTGPALAPPAPTPALPAGPPKRDLTAREREVAALMPTKTNKEIADQLVIGERTVETHAANVMAKLGVHSRTEVVSV